MEGCVYLDEADRQMILLRAGGKTMPLALSSVKKERRFTFYDQVRSVFRFCFFKSGRRFVLSHPETMPLALCLR